MGEPSASPPSFKHIHSLDGIRGLAILLVLGFHLLWSNDVTGSRFLDFIVELRSSGWIGVDLFFALSGFLITGILLDTRQKPHFFRNFYVRRVLRIAPLYYVVLAILLLGFHPTSWIAARPFGLLLAYLQNTPLWWNSSVPGLVGNFTSHLWSLAAEEQFYLVWPLVVLLIPSRRTLLWTAALLAAASPVLRFVLLAHGAPFQATYKLTLCRADSLLAGAWLAIANRGHLNQVLRRVAPYTLAASLLACLAIAWRTGSFEFDHNRTVNLVGYSILAVASTSLIALALSPASTVARLLRTPALRFFGKYSYGLYVLHQMVAAVLEYRFGGLLRSSIHQKPLLHLASMALVLAITLPLAMLSFHLLERPFLRLKRFFDARPHPRSSPGTQQAVGPKIAYPPGPPP